MDVQTGYRVNGENGRGRVARAARVLGTTSSPAAHGKASRPVPRVSARRLAVVLPIEGLLASVRGNGDLRAGPDRLVILAQLGPGPLLWDAGGRGAVLSLPRAALQIVLSRKLGAAHRFASSDIRVPLGGRSAALHAWLDPLAGMPGAEMPPMAVEALADLLIGDERGREFILPARAVQRAVAEIEADPDGDLSGVRLARLAGVTPRTLCDGFRNCLGVPLARTVQDVRLDRVRARLIGGRDSRSIADIAAAAGIKHISHFARVYAQRFGETPSQSRARAVKNWREP